MILLGGSSMHKGANGWHAARAISCLPALSGDFGLSSISVLRPRDYVELSTPAAPSLFDGPPSLSTEGQLIKYVFVVVAASLLGSRRRLRHRVLSMRLLLVPEWRGGHLIC
jgi:hypothetical protein